MKKYDFLIKLYSSWVDDFLDPTKGFTNEELGLLFTAICRAQLEKNVSLIEELPKPILRGLQVHTLIEQTQRIIERTERMKERGKKANQRQREQRESELEFAIIDGEAKDQAAEAKKLQQERNEVTQHYWKQIAIYLKCEIRTILSKLKDDEQLQRECYEMYPYKYEVSFETWKANLKL